MSISIRLNKVDTDLIKSYASMLGMNVSELVSKMSWIILKGNLT